MPLSNSQNNQPTLLVVHAHPDDESISTGGVLAKYSENGFRTVLAYCTKGEAGDILNPNFVFPAPGMSITDIRAIELEKALKVLDVKSVSSGVGPKSCAKKRWDTNTLNVFKGAVQPMAGKPIFLKDCIDNSRPCFPGIEPETSNAAGWYLIITTRPSCLLP